MNKGVEMLDQSIPAGNDALVFVQPREQAFNLPASSVSTEHSPIAQFSNLMFAFLMMSACNAKRSASSAANCPGDEEKGTSAWLSSFS